MSGSLDPAVHFELERIQSWHDTLERSMHRLEVCPSAEVGNAYRDLLDTLEQTFALEHQVMETYAFPAIQCHLEQHARVLGGLHHLHSAVMRGADEPGRHAGSHLLRRWFELHQVTLDASVGLWVVCCTSRESATTLRRRATDRVDIAEAFTTSPRTRPDTPRRRGTDHLPLW